MIRKSAALSLVVLLSTSSARADDVDEAAPRAGAEVDAKPTLVLHVDSPSIVAVERVDTGELVCTSPCDVAVDAAASYRVGGSRPSKPFVLDGKSGRAAVAVDPATKRGLTTGLVVLGVGGASLASGAVTLALAYAGKSPVAGSGGDDTSTGYTDATTAGMVLVLSGLALAVWGGAKTLANLESKVDGDVVPGPPARGTAPSPPPRTATAPSLFVPIFGGAPRTSTSSTG